MPRPGSRSYDCVRRSWHSDKHQPIRGTLIQEIFRIVNEIHSSSTKKNKEYEEKLPVVVLRVEEIIYSKANSEAEYMDLTTLLERANDAINTIIRRDESAETGEYLQPCIEAALNLGCSPRKASRSERNSPRSYLSPNTQELPSGGDDATKSQYVSKCSNFLNSLKSTRLGSEYQPFALQNEDSILTTNTLPFVSKNISSTSNNQCLEHHQPSNLFSVYPLYYGNHYQFDESQQGLKVPERPVSNTLGPAIMGVQSHLAFNINASNQRSQTLIRGNPENPRAIGCDLSLRLGPFSIPALSVENGQTSLKDKRLSSFVGDKGYGTLDCYSSKCRFQDESLSEQSTVAGKRKAYLGEPVKNQKLCLPP